jgi:hypothetical protein
MLNTDRNPSAIPEDAESSIIDRSSSGGASCTTHTAPGNNNENIPGIASKESKAVNQLRVIVFAVLLLAAMLVSVIVYLITSTSEEHAFKVQYEGMAGQLIDAFHGIVTQKLSVVGSLRVSLMAHALDIDPGWPFVTLSSFQQRAETIRRLSNSVSIGTYPVIEESKRSEWEKYVATEAPKWM